MKIISSTGSDNIATVYMAEMASRKYVEFVESTQPPVPKEKKWVVIVSVLYGCPVGCSICDAGGWYRGKLTKDDMLSQIRFVVNRNFPGGHVPVKKFKIQFARMGEPALNTAVLDVLEALPGQFDAPGLLPCISTVAPQGCDSFFQRLVDIKNRHYGNGKFQLQFSIHSTDETARDRIIPVKKWDFEQIARYGKKFWSPGDRKITLNFALSEDFPVDQDVIQRYFDPNLFFIKLTPVNPTLRAQENHVTTAITEKSQWTDIDWVQVLHQKGYDVLVSIGEMEENRIGSNCGQYIRRFLETESPMNADSYRYKMRDHSSGSNN